jgi:hypothetical protein
MKLEAEKIEELLQFVQLNSVQVKVQVLQIAPLALW